MKKFSDYTDIEIQYAFQKILENAEPSKLTDFHGNIKLNVLQEYFDVNIEDAKRIRFADYELDPRWVLVYSRKGGEYQLVDRIDLRGTIYIMDVIIDGINLKDGRVIVDNLNKLK